MKVGTSLSGPYSLIKVVTSIPNSSTALLSNASIRIRCSARAISSRWTLDVNASSSSVSSRLRERTVRVSPSRSDRDDSSRDRCADAFAIERSMWISDSYAASAIACEISAPRARAPRRDTARSEASRSARAPSSSDSARADKESTRSSLVRTESRASTSAVRAPETRWRNFSVKE